MICLTYEKTTQIDEMQKKIDKMQKNLDGIIFLLIFALYKQQHN